MKKTFISIIIFLSSSLFLTSTSFSQQKFDEGIDYKKIGSSQKSNTSGKIEVIEFFWFGCPHCKNFYPALKKWAENKPSYVKYTKLHVPFRDINHQRLYFTIREMGLTDKLIPKIFVVIQENTRPLNNLLSILDWLEDQNINTSDFEEKWNSESVKNSMEKATKLMKKFKITGVPQIVVDGTYLTSPAMVGGSHRRAINVIDYLISKQHKNT